ncbi:DUF4373 domain-containing protein [Paenibacillus sp. HW567]|uniref:DUF4373 domain-containing protein n=1 Tax=Paenibacillus sp. HW567 TaxID=1034769 RepID=UPI00037D0768|nr:DUF4373 domain-containing protein [Paenibacillus sp. HW567]
MREDKRDGGDVARPRKEGMDYFSHDTDAVNDEKIEAMRAMFGNDGYAFYFIMLERIYRSSVPELDLSKKVFKASIIGKLMVDEKRFNQMMDAAFDIELFDRQAYEQRMVITSNGIRKRSQEVQQLRDRWRKKKDKGGDNSNDGEEGP